MTEEIRQGDVLDRLREMPDASVQCVVTSPPYFGLRDYGTDVWEGGDPDCDHRIQSRGNPETAAKYVVKSTLVGTTTTQQHQQEASYGQVCGKCGARRVSPWVGGDPACDHRLDTAHQAPGATSQRQGRSNVEAQRNENYRSVCGKCGARRAGHWTGGDPDCDHSMARARAIGNAPSLKSTLTTNSGAGPRPGDKFHADQRREVATECPCGARWTTSQLGLEQTPEDYVARLVDVFREVRRVLRQDGVVWLNLGDSYAAQGGGKAPGLYADKRTDGATWEAARRPPVGAKSKDLLGIPWMVAFALRADGWYLRSDVIWAKPNPMPESVTDRPTNAHEHVFLLTKSARYFYDAEAIREKAKDWSHGGPGTGIANTAERYGAGNGGNANAGLSALAQRYKQQRQADRKSDAVGLNGRNVQAVNAESDRRDEIGSFNNNPGLRPQMGRNKRNVWEIPTQPYPEAHFATFPTKLVEPCILAGSSPRACGRCGAPWQRVVELGEKRPVRGNPIGELDESAKQDGSAVAQYGGMGNMVRTDIGWSLLKRDRFTTGWQPTCDHDDWGLDLSRPQARRARQLAIEHGLTPEHIAAIRACGITDAGKSQVTQDGYGKNDPQVQALADEAKAVLGGYYREFTFARRARPREAPCAHDDDSGRCVVLDPFAGSGTVGVVARWHGRDFIGIELNADYCEMARRRILLEGNPGRRAQAAQEPIPGQMTMEFD